MPIMLSAAYLTQFPGLKFSVNTLGLVQLSHMASFPHRNELHLVALLDNQLYGHGLLIPSVGWKYYNFFFHSLKKQQS